MDYLLRDSLHAGVDYGRYDWRRLLNTVEAVRVSEAANGDAGGSTGLRWGSTRGESTPRRRWCWPASLCSPRSTFTRPCRLRPPLAGRISGTSAGRRFSRPNDREIGDYLAWDDWRVLGKLAAGEGGEHGRRLASRNHYREVYHTPESPTASDLERLDQARDALGDLVCAESARKSHGTRWEMLTFWYSATPMIEGSCPFPCTPPSWPSCVRQERSCYLRTPGTARLPANGRQR